MNRREQITRRFRKVAWGRLYWKGRNPGMRRFDNDDVCIVVNGVITTHYKTVEALVADIENEERPTPPALNRVLRVEDE